MFGTTGGIYRSGVRVDFLSVSGRTYLGHKSGRIELVSVVRFDLDCLFIIMKLKVSKKSAVTH